MQQAKRYAQIMRDMEDAPESAASAVRFMTRMLPDIYETMRPADIIRAEITQVVTAAKTLHFTMQEVILPAFSILADDPGVEQEESVFDEYDREEGYDQEDDTNVWAACLESIEIITQAAITIMRQSYTDTMNEEMVPLIEHLKWEIDHQPKEQKGG